MDVLGIPSLQGMAGSMNSKHLSTLLFVLLSRLLSSGLRF